MTGQGSNATIDFEPGAELLELVSRHDAIGRQFGEQNDQITGDGRLALRLREGNASSLIRHGDSSIWRRDGLLLVGHAELFGAVSRVSSLTAIVT